MMTMEDLRKLPVMDTGDMNIWWEYALIDWDELCCEESIYGGRSRRLPRLPKQEFVLCYLRENVDADWDVRLKDYISALNSKGFLNVQFPEGVRAVSVNSIVLYDSDVNLTIEYIRNGFLQNLHKFDNTYKGYVDSNGNLVAITRTVNETGEISVLLSEHVSYEKTFGISLECIRDYLYDEESSWNHWSEEKLRA